MALTGSTRAAGSLAVLAGVLMGTVALRAQPAAATVTDVESSSITPAACWASLNGANYQGGSTRHCVTAAQPISWTVAIPTGEEGTVAVHGLLDTSARTGRIRINGGTWTSTTATAGALTYKALQYTSPTLAAGAHTFDLEYVSGANVHFDFYRVTTSAPETTTTTTLPPTTTTQPATTTTTAPPGPLDGKTFAADLRCAFNEVSGPEGPDRYYACGHPDPGGIVRVWGTPDTAGQACNGTGTRVGFFPCPYAAPIGVRPVGHPTDARPQATTTVVPGGFRFHIANTSCGPCMPWPTRVTVETAATWGSVPAGGGGIVGVYEASQDPGDGSPYPRVPGLSAQTPTVGCKREWMTVNGVPSVRVVGRVLNPQPGATDVMRVRASWVGTWVTGNEQTLPLPDVATKPPAGWLGSCEVVRTLDADTNGSTGWSANAVRIKDDGGSDTSAMAMGGTVIAGQVFYGAGRAIYSQFEWNQLNATQRHFALEGKVVDTTGNLVRMGTPDIPGGSTSKAVATYNGPPKGPVTSTGVKKIVQTGGKLVTHVAAPAVAAWVWTGSTLGAGSDLLAGNLPLDVFAHNEFFCKYNPGYAAVNGEGCAQFQEAERATSQVRDAVGNVINPDEAGTTAWRSATSQADVRIDPARPELGASNVSGLEPVELTPQQEDAAAADMGLEKDATTGDYQHQAPEDNRALDPAAGTGPSCNVSGWGFLNPFNIAESIGCVLQRLFMPSPGLWGEVTGGLSQQFPLNVIADVTGTVNLVVDWFTTALGDACGVFDYSTVEQSGGTPNLALKIKLPNPTGSTCPTNSASTTAGERDAGDLFGWRNELRMALSALLWLGFATQIIRAFQPKETDLEPNIPVAQ